MATGDDKAQAKERAAERKRQIASAAGSRVVHVMADPTARTLRVNVLQDVTLPGGVEHRVGRDIEISYDDLSPELKKQAVSFGKAIGKLLGAKVIEAAEE